MSKKIKNYNDVKELAKEAEIIVNEFKSCQSYMKNLGIIRDAERSVDMYEGRQYLDYKGLKMPFELPILNLFMNIIDGKVANICSKNYKLEFVIENDRSSTQKITKFTETINRDLRQPKMYRKMVLDTLLKGTGLKYDFWNNGIFGISGNMEGGIDTSLIDIHDFAVSNPRESDINKQDWIIVRSRESVDTVRNSCDTMSEKKAKEYIVSTTYNPQYPNDNERQNSNNVYSYTKFFRQDNEVYFQKCTNDIMYQFPRAISPLLNEEVIRNRINEEKDKIDSNTQSEYLNDSESNKNFEQATYIDEAEQMQNKFKANRYPFVKMCFIPRDNSFFGVSYGSQLIGNQKLINQLACTTMVTALKSIMPTVVVKAGALGTQKVDFSKPNGIITDFSGSGVNDAIKILNTGTIPTTHYELAQSLTSFVKDIYRANDILNDGRNIGANASGVLVSNLNSLQQMPVQQWQEEYADTLADEGRIYEMFYKLFYHNKKFTYEISSSEMSNKQVEQQELNDFDVSNYTKYQTDVFEGDDYINTPFNISVIVSETSKTSESTSLAIIETLFLNGVISKLSSENLAMLAKLLPINVFPQKDELLRMSQEMENGEKAQLKQQLAQATQMLQQAAARGQLIEQEYKSKINQSNENLKQLGQIVQSLMRNQKLNGQQN